MTGDVNTSSELKEKYDEYYNEDESEWRDLSGKPKAKNIVRLCSDVPHDLILDMGAGDGAIAQHLSDYGFGESIYCTEISSSGVKSIKQREIDVVKEVLHFDGYNLTYDDDMFDLGIATHVLEHVEHERAFLKELARVSRYVYIEVPLEDTARLSDDYTRNELGHINFYNYKTIRRKLQTTDYDVLEQELFTLSRRSLTYNFGQAKGLFYYTGLKMGELIHQRTFSKLLPYHCGLVCETK
jgi:ubiquinone/menaquinone biosynthesis C-methylase UbiE